MSPFSRKKVYGSEEHDMDVVQRYSQRVLVFNDGRVIADGPPASVLAYPEVRKAVLGQE